MRHSPDECTFWVRGGLFTWPQTWTAGTTRHGFAGILCPTADKHRHTMPTAHNALVANDLPVVGQHHGYGTQNVGVFIHSHRQEGAQCFILPESSV